MNIINPIFYTSEEDYKKSNAKFNNSAIKPIYYIETWREINEVMPEVKNGVYISNMGNVYDANRDIIKTELYDKDGYPRISIPSIINNKVVYNNTPIHRLVGLAFIENPDPEKYTIINHKDGIKFHSYDENLEWTDYSGNIIHAYDNNLRVSGENHPWAILTEAQVRKICEGLVKRMRFDDICIELLDMEPTAKMMSIITTIRTGENWRSISSQYNIPKAKRNTSFFTDDQIHEICKMLEEGKNNYEISDGLGIDVRKLSTDQRLNIFEIISRIRRKERFTRISENYNF